MSFVTNSTIQGQTTSQKAQQEMQSGNFGAATVTISQPNSHTKQFSDKILESNKEKADQLVFSLFSPIQTEENLTAALERQRPALYDFSQSKKLADSSDSENSSDLDEVESSSDSEEEPNQLYPAVEAYVCALSKKALAKMKPEKEPHALARS